MPHTKKGNNVRIKTALLIVFATVLFFGMGFLWQINEIQRGKADETQLGKETTIQPATTENGSVSLSVSDTATQVKVGDAINYVVSYTAKKDLKNARIVGALGETGEKVSPQFVWNLGDLKSGTSGSFTVPIVVKKGGSVAASRITISETRKFSFWTQEKREILATADDINQIVE